ncbi:MAG: hypothetical protein CMO30_16310 [Tistrella sp.]|uniref:ABC3 transporter permease C-terminal domain-containing protein n=1 Tax=Tistrella mobilis TaxID=171437 RepID=A0A3B9IKN6_9PROT|nr:FtsX-like permease family protein [Tistrella sp.]MAD38549.1 hypothetical protein [Tistrella sp.]MBA76834.1 hypothetical protein [Tistrella sp.]HAE48432.1 hypothetical protein [Tistrella mobilis]
MIGRRGAGLPLGRDLSARFLPWLLAPMAALLALALIAIGTADRAIDRWAAALGDRATVWLPASEDQDHGPDARLGPLIGLLEAEPLVREIRPVPREDAEALVSPWLGPELAEVDLPLPTLVDLTLAPARPGEIEALSDRIADLIEGARLERPGDWVARLAAIGRTVQAAAAGLGALFGLAAVLAVIFAVKTALAIHRETIDILHVMGAPDDYVARQFAMQGLRVGFWGGLTGSLVAAALVFAAGAVLPETSAPLLPRLDPGPVGWGGLILVTPALAVVAALVARITVIRRLRAMP